MKKLLLLWLFSGSLDSFSQETKTLEYPPKPIEARIYKRPDFRIDTVYNTPDTLRAELLVTYTTRRWGVAHARDGYVVRKGNEVTYLDNNHKPFPMCVTVWGWVKWEERKRRGR